MNCNLRVDRRTNRLLLLAAEPDPRWCAANARAGNAHPRTRIRMRPLPSHNSVLEPDKCAATPLLKSLTHIKSLELASHMIGIETARYLSFL